MLATQTATPEEIYSSSIHHPFYQQGGQYHQLQQHDAQSIMLPTSTPDQYPYHPYGDPQQLQHIESSEEMQRLANFLHRREWMKRVAEWIAQTEMTGNHKPQRLDSIPEATEDIRTSGEEVLYVASPPSASTPLYPFANPVYMSSSPSSSSSSLSSAKSSRRLSHGRTPSLESISEEAEE